MGARLAGDGRECRLVPLCAALQPAHAGDVGHRPLGRVADGRYRGHLDPGLLYRFRADASREGFPAVRNGAAAARGWWPRWAPAWKIKYPASSYRINFDIHRAFGLWVWIPLFILAFTAFSLNLYREVFYPVMSTISKVTPTPFRCAPPNALDKPIEAKITYPAVLETARREGQRRGWTVPPGSIFYSSPWGIYGVSFF